MNQKYKIVINKLTDNITNIRIGNTNKLAIHRNKLVYLYNITYEEQNKSEEGPKILDIKDFVFEQLITYKERNTCKCCLNFMQLVSNNNNFYELVRFNDDLYFKKTVLYKGKDEIEIFISFNESCTCNKLAEYKKNLETKRKHEKEIEDLKKFAEEMKRQSEEREKKLKEEKKKEDEIKNQQIERLKDFNLSIKRQLDMLFRKINEDAQKEKMEKKEKIEKKNKAKNYFLANLPKSIESFYKKNIEKMVSNLRKGINKLFDEKLSFEISKDLIKEIAEEENFALNIKDILENEINSISDKDIVSKINHFNILVMGRSGVGKSTLINKVLKKELAKTKDFDYCTVNIESYESEKVLGLRIWDTRGIEYKYNLDDAFHDISTKINELINEKNPDKYIHCIWFCIKGEKGERLNREIQEIIQNCYNLYTIQKLPIIIVFTNSSSTEESNQFIDFARKEFHKVDDLNYINKVKFVRVLAKAKKTDLGTIKPNGIYNLMEETFDSVKNGMKSSLIESLTQKGKEFIKKKLQKIVDNIEYKEDLDDAPIFNTDPNLPDNLSNKNTFLSDNNYSNNNNNSSEDEDEAIFDPNNFNNLKPSKNKYFSINGSFYGPKPLSNTNWNIQNNNLNPNKLNKTHQFNIFDNFDNFDDDNKVQTPMEEFDIFNLPLNLEKVKYSIKSFKINLQNNCEKIAVKLLHVNVLTNKKLFSKVFNSIENNINIINEKFEEIYEKKGKDIYDKLSKRLLTVLINACSKNDLDKDKYIKIFTEKDLFIMAQNIVDQYFKDRIESKIYEEIQGKIVEKYAEEFKNNLLLYFDELILKNSTISNIFNKQGEENTNLISNRIRSSIFYEKDDPEIVFQKSYQNVNNNFKKDNSIIMDQNSVDNKSIYSKKDNIKKGNNNNYNNNEAYNINKDNNNNNSDEEYDNSLKEVDSDDNNLEKENEDK